MEIPAYSPKDVRQTQVLSEFMKVTQEDKGGGQNEFFKMEGFS